MKSKYDGECYISNGGCGATHKVGDEVGKNGLKNSNGNDCWCIHGTQCPKTGTSTTTAQSNLPTTSAVGDPPAKTDESSIILFAQKALTGFLASVTANNLKEIDVKDQLGPVFSTAIITASKR